MSIAGVRGTFGDRRDLTGSVGLPPLPNPVFSPYWFLATVPRELWDRERACQFYELDFRNINGGETRTQFLAVGKEGIYLLLGISSLAENETNPPTRPAVDPTSENFLIQITSSLQGPIFESPVPLENVACMNGGNSPGVPYPIAFESGDMLAVQITSLWTIGAVTQQALRLTFQGAIFK